MLRLAVMLLGLLWATSDTTWRRFRGEGSRCPASLFSGPVKPTPVEKLSQSPPPVLPVPLQPRPAVRPHPAPQGSAGHSIHPKLRSSPGFCLLWRPTASSPPHPRRPPLFPLCPFACSPRAGTSSSGCCLSSDLCVPAVTKPSVSPSSPSPPLHECRPHPLRNTGSRHRASPPSVSRSISQPHCPLSDAPHSAQPPYPRWIGLPRSLLAAHPSPSPTRQPTGYF